MTKFAILETRMIQSGDRGKLVAIDKQSIAYPAERKRHTAAGNIELNEEDFKPSINQEEKMSIDLHVSSLFPWAYPTTPEFGLYKEQRAEAARSYLRTMAQSLNLSEALLNNGEIRGLILQYELAEGDLHVVRYEDPKKRKTIGLYMTPKHSKVGLVDAAARDPRLNYGPDLRVNSHGQEDHFPLHLNRNLFGKGGELSTNHVGKVNARIITLTPRDGSTKLYKASQ